MGVVVISGAMPRRSAPWREEDGRVVVAREQPAIRGFSSLRAWVSWAWRPKKIRLDELGSFVWRRLDGATSLDAIIAEFRGEFPDGSEEIEGRLGDFVAALCKLGLASFDDAASD
jgi:hypothetical protein